MSTAKRQYKFNNLTLFRRAYNLIYEIISIVSIILFGLIKPILSNIEEDYLLYFIDRY